MNSHDMCTLLLVVLGVCLASVPSVAGGRDACMRHGREHLLPEHRERYDRALGWCANFTASPSRCRHACQAHALALEFPLCGAGGAAVPVCDRVCDEYKGACGAPPGECTGGSSGAEGAAGCGMGPYPPELWPPAAQPEYVARPGAPLWATGAHARIFTGSGGGGGDAAGEERGSSSSSSRARALQEQDLTSVAGYTSVTSTTGCSSEEVISLVDGGRPFTVCPAETGSCRGIMGDQRYNGGVWLEQPDTMRGTWSDPERWLLPLPMVLLREFFGSQTPKHLEVCVFDRRYVLPEHWVARLSSPDYLASPHASQLTVQAPTFVDSSKVSPVSKKYQYSIFVPTVDTAAADAGAAAASMGGRRRARQLLALSQRPGGDMEAGEVYANTDFSPIRATNATVEAEVGIGWMQLAGRRRGQAHQWYTFLGCHSPCTISNGAPPFSPRTLDYNLVVREAYADKQMLLEVATVPEGTKRTVTVNGARYETDDRGLLGGAEGTDVLVYLDGAATSGVPNAPIEPSVVTIVVEGGATTYSVTIRYNPPVATVDYGDFCTTSIECMSGNCTQAGVCGRGAFGFPCSGGGQCKSGSCVLSQCGPARVGGECASDDQCVSLRCDTSDTRRCLPAPFDGACLEGFECTTGRCVGDVCAPGPYQTPCRVDLGGADCISGLCTAPFIGGPATCGPAPFNFDCARGEDCQSGSCSAAGVCEKAAVGGFCRADPDCVSENCDVALSQCDRVRYLAPCAEDGDCVSGNCDAGKCERAARGGGCDRNTDCLSLDCAWSPEETRSVCGQAGYGIKCDRNSDCRSDICEVNEDFGVHPVCGPAPFGFPCAAGGECKSGQCTDGVCSKGENGNTCTAGAECLSEYCDFATSTCRAAPLGFPCERDDQCWSANCFGVLVNGRLSQACGPAPFGFACRTNDECQSSSCDLTTNTCAKLPLGGICTAGDECASGNCDGGACGLVLPGSLCRSDDECLTSNCNTTGFTNAGFGYCGLVLFGGGCVVDGECVSQLCRSGAAASAQGRSCSQGGVGSGCRINADCITGGCEPSGLCSKGSFGFTCTMNDECVSGACINPGMTGECGPHELGQKCEENFECGSNVCSAAKVCSLVAAG